MKIRIKFSKQGAMKFIGHLDTMRYFQKAMRRADVDIRYSEGFSPHQIMSFAAPLGVGLTWKRRVPGYRGAVHGLFRGDGETAERHDGGRR